MTARKPTLFDLRSGGIDALHLSPRTEDLAALLQALQQRLDGAPDFLSGESLVIDLRRMPEGSSLDVDALAAWLREHGLHALGVVADALPPAVRLPLLHSQERRADAAPQPAATGEPAPTAGAATSATAAATSATVVIERPLRSGQRVYSAGDLIVLDVVSHGAEIIAAGNIHVYAALRGRALAGAHGDTSARIFCSCLEPELVAVAGVYRTAEAPLPPEVAGQAAQIRLDGDSLRIEALRKR